jgi:glycolate oxidase iron-sulfur subunit
MEYEAHTGTLPAPVRDISAYLSELKWPEAFDLLPLEKRVAVHTPCSLKNILGEADAPFQILARIPGMELIPLPENGKCCGGAGLQMITEPETADTLRSDKLRAIKNHGINIVVTSNTGCALHLKAGIREEELEAEVLHPVELLSRQMK